MSVIKCKECGHGVSTKAKTCPSCGAPIAKPTSCAGGCLVVVLLGVSIVICLAAINGYNTPTNHRPSKTTYRPSNTAKPSAPKPSTPTIEIPADVTYTVAVKQIMPGIKRSLEVTLDQRITEDVLRALAHKLKNEDPNEYERTFILYYLKDIKNPVAAWATTHFNPDLKVVIMGLTVEDEKSLLEAPVDTEHDKIGRWLDDSPYAGGIITIYRDNGKYIYEQKFTDGSVMTKELVERPSPLGRRFNLKEETYANDHFVIDRNGTLQFRDDEGLITTANKLE